ncbi:MAG: PAS domain-containing protein [Magnetococcales bacterium]|nr:PAS domain-containing protein [Magnetococcales bacterium]
MALDIRGKYILSFLLLVFAAILTADIYLEYALGDWLESQLVAELRRHAMVGRAFVESQETPLTMERLDPLANLLGQDPEIRVSLIGEDGVVLGDSQRQGEALRTMENHGKRPEVVTAMRDGFGQSKHYSATLSRSMLYVAVSFHHPLGERGVVRVAIAIESVESINNRLNLALFVAGLIAVITALSLGGFSAHWATNTQRYIMACAQRMVHSAAAPRIQVHANDAMAGLASSLNLLAAEKHETLALLSEQKSQLATVLQSMTEGVIALDRAGRVTLMNRSVLELLGLSSPSIGQPIAALLPAYVVAELRLALEPLPMQPFSVEFDWDGVVLQRVVAVMTPLYEHEGHLIVLRDVTERRRLDLMRRDFVANVSHELRTPVSIIQANAQTLLDGALEEQGYNRVLVDAVERNASRLAQIISDLLELSRLEANQFAMELEHFYLLPVVQEVVALIQTAADDKQIAIQVEILPDLRVYADTEVVRRILSNFLDNAVKYIPTQSRIVVRSTPCQGRIRLEVVDNGAGIAPQHWGRLFERFYRVDSGRSRKMGGTGLGLAIVRHLAEKMGEKVGMEDVKPHGSLFWVTLSTVSDTDL